MKNRTEKMIIKGKLTSREVYFFDGKEIIISGSRMKMAQIKEEWDVDIDDPEKLVQALKISGIQADLFTFVQRLPESKPKFIYPMEWDNVAALPISTYDHWLKKQLYQNPRNKIRIAEKKGVIVKKCEFNDEFVRGITAIYNETPVRQGRPYWNFGMDFDLAKLENSEFLDRADFIGAYYNDELIGYIRIVYTNRYARTMGLLAKIEHRDKAPMNALMAKAVELSAEKKIPYLVYAKYNYGKLGSDSLMDFKRSNGFESIMVPRYYIPLTLRGRIFLKLNLHHGIVGFLPKKAVRFLRNARNAWYERKSRNGTNTCLSGGDKNRATQEKGSTE